MLKRLLVLPIFLMLAGCLQNNEKINSAGSDGTCTNGKCNDKKGGKPAACNSSTTFKTFVGETFESQPITSGKVKLWTQVKFDNTTLTYTQFCTEGSLFGSPTVTIDYSHDSGRIRFNGSGSGEQVDGALTCKASVTNETFNYKIEGKCLVLTSVTEKSPIYYIRK